MVAVADKSVEFVKLVEEAYPDWKGFADPRFEKHEVTYKLKAAEFLQETLSKERLDGLIADGQFDEVIDRLWQIGQKTKLLYNSVPSRGDLSVLAAENLDKEGFCRTFANLLYGSDSVEQRLDDYVGYLDAHELPNKWACATYFLFIAHPDSEIFVKPQAAKWFLKRMGSNLQLGSKADGDTYRQFKASVQEFRDSLPDSLTPRNMIDIQGMIWVAKSSAKRGKGVPNGTQATVPNVWKIAPGENARKWDEWIEKDIVSVGWSELGDISQLTTQREFDEAVENFKSAYPEIEYKGARQAWRFAHRIKVGDIVVANRGTQEILGVGRVTGDYKFEQDDEYSHQRPVEWIDLEPKTVEEAGWRRTVIELPKDYLDNLAHDESDDADLPVFTERTFELLDIIHGEPRHTTYEEHKGGFVQQVEQPFKKLFTNVINRLPTVIVERMETTKRLFSRFCKNDWGQGGAWDFYWGAIYDKGSKRTEGAQLFGWINHEMFKVGFSIGQYGGQHAERFLQNLRKHRPVLTELLGNIGELGLAFGGSKTTSEWSEWLSAPDEFGWTIAKIVSREECLLRSASELEELTLRTFNQLFPLVLLAIEDDPLDVLREYLETEDDEAELNPIYSLDECSDSTGFKVEQLQHWANAIERKKQAIFYGPPGTGKTYIARELARHLIGGGDGFCETVQFHPAYEYEDFVLGIRPSTRHDGSLEYSQVPGRFIDFCNETRKRRGRCVLIIDEINRANLARVFGELMFLLEYRNEEVPLAGGKLFRIPENVRIIGTMNTADRSIALVDHALRRRFAFLELRPDYDVLRKFHDEGDYDVGPLISLLQKLNRQINDPHYEVGISFFIDPVIESNLASIWKLEIEPYLEEYFFDQVDKVEEFRWCTVKDQLL